MEPDRLNIRTIVVESIFISLLLALDWVEGEVWLIGINNTIEVEIVHDGVLLDQSAPRCRALFVFFMLLLIEPLGGLLYNVWTCQL